MKTEKGPNIPGPIFTDCLSPENGKCLNITLFWEWSERRELRLTAVYCANCCNDTLSKVSAFRHFISSYYFRILSKFGLRKDLCFFIIFHTRNWNSWYLRSPGQLYFSNEHILSLLTTSFSFWCVPNKWNSNLSNVSGFPLLHNLLLKEGEPGFTNI